MNQEHSPPMVYSQQTYFHIKEVSERQLMTNEIHCAHILVKSEKETQSVIDKLNHGEKFANLASEVSLCPSRKRGGDLGTFGRGRMLKEFEQAAFSLQKGQVSGIVKTKFGYHVIKRLE